MHRAVLKKLAGLLFGNYRLNRIYTLDLCNYEADIPEGLTVGRIDGPDELMASGDPAVRSRAWCARGEETYGFGLWENGELACMCWFWTHRRFRDYKIWRLKDGEAIMVELLTVGKFRGRGFAPALIRYAAAQIKQEKFNRLYTWVWHSNEPSIRSFEKAGWHYAAFVTEFHLFAMKPSLRLTRSTSGSEGGP